MECRLNLGALLVRGFFCWGDPVFGAGCWPMMCRLDDFTEIKPTQIPLCLEEEEAMQLFPTARNASDSLMPVLSLPTHISPLCHSFPSCFKHMMCHSPSNHLSLPFFRKITVKERLSTQQLTKGTCQWYQKEEAYQVRFHQRNGP